MLKLPRRRVAFRTGAASGWLSPRNEGPLMTGAFSDNGAEVRGAACGAVLCEAALCGFTPLDGGAGAEGTGARRGVGRFAVLSAGTTATGTASVNSFAPHMPQKRFASEFSLPQRAQRNRSLLSSIYSLRYLEHSLQYESRRARGGHPQVRR